MNQLKYFAIILALLSSPLSQAGLDEDLRSVVLAEIQKVDPTATQDHLKSLQEEKIAKSRLDPTVWLYFYGNKYVVKVFGAYSDNPALPKVQRDGEKEFKAISLLHDMKFHGIDAVEIISSSQRSFQTELNKKFEAFILVQTRAPGESLEQLFEKLGKLESPSDRAKLVKEGEGAFRKVGRALAEINTRELRKLESPSDISSDIDYIETFRSTVATQLKTLADKHILNIPEGQNIESLIQNLDQYYEQIKTDFFKSIELENEYLCFAHGDPNPGNFVVAAGSENVAPVDLSRFTASFDENKQPKSPWGREYFNSLHTLPLYGFRYGLESAEILTFTNAFRDDYRQLVSKKGIQISAAAENFFQFYWMSLWIFHESKSLIENPDQKNAQEKLSHIQSYLNDRKILRDYL